MPGHVKMFLEAVGAILVDEGFKVPSQKASDAVKAATLLFEWSKGDANQVIVSRFSATLVEYLRNCLPPVNDPIKRDVMWCNFHTLRTSKDYFMLWNQFLKGSIQAGFDPIFFQYITDHIFKQLIKQVTSRSRMNLSDDSDRVETLSYEEKKALRYAAGYVPRNLLAKIKRSGQLRKEGLELCLIDLIEEDGIYDESQEWTNILDRGGLLHINTKTFLVMTAMEVVVKTILKRKVFPKADIKSELIGAIFTDENVQLHWNTVSAEWESEQSKVLFKMIVELWVTMRGFSYGSMWMEQHKQETKKTNQKSKGLRKNLITS